MKNIYTEPEFEVVNVTLGSDIVTTSLGEGEGDI